MVGSEELSLPYRIDSIGFLFLNVCCLYRNYKVFKRKNALENQRIHDEQLAIHEEELDEQLDMQMNIAPGAWTEFSWNPILKLNLILLT